MEERADMVECKCSNCTSVIFNLDAHDLKLFYVKITV